MRKNSKRLLIAAIAMVVTVAAIAWTARRAQAQSAEQSHLLFTFVTNQFGLDTLITISNTSQDPFGTPPADGACVFFFFGAAAPAPYTTPFIPAGTTFANLTSIIAPGFQGYVIADCNFHLAHGWYFTADVGAVHVLTGSAALVLPSTFRTGSPPESLAH